MKTVLYEPGAAEREASLLARFLADIKAREGTDLKTYADLHRWSIGSIDAFWQSVWQFCGVIGDPGERSLVDGDDMLRARFFPDARLNFAENLLRRHEDRPNTI